jgi:hypothetical protein
MPSISLSEQQFIVGKINGICQLIGLAIGTDQPYCVIGEIVPMALLIQQLSDLCGIVAFAVQQHYPHLAKACKISHRKRHHAHVVDGVIEKTHSYRINRWFAA